MSIDKLSPEQLYRKCQTDSFSFKTTNELKALDNPFFGQKRALTSAEFGMKMKTDGFNIYALGPDEVNKRTLLETLIKQEAEQENIPEDWVYVCNFKDEQKPIAIKLPAGDAVRFRDTMNRFAEDLPNVLTSTFESEEYQNRRQAIEDRLKEDEHKEFSELQEQVESKGLTILHTPMGYSLAPVRDGKIMDMEEIQKLSDQERKELEKEIQHFQKELQKILRLIPERQRKFRKKRNELNREYAEFSVRGLLEEIRNEFSQQSDVLEYLEEVKDDIIEHVREILNPGASNPLMQAMGGKQEFKGPPSEHPVLWRYTVNVIIDNSDAIGAPVVYEDHPTFKNLIGRIEHESQMGTLTTDFTYIKQGALHKANGGYLLIDALRLLTQPFAWEGLKRALQNNKLIVESPGDMYGMLSTVTLEPAPIKLDVKVVLIGSRLLYYLLCAYDEDFSTLFKVEVDFEEEIDWDDKTQELYARLIAGLLQKYELNHMDSSGVARTIEHASRMVNDNQKMTTRIKDIIDLLREADYWSRQNGTEVIDRKAVQKAVDQREYRSGRLKDRYQESILRKSIFIDTEGEKIGQVNGLSVITLGNSVFAHPTRITARTRVGKGEVVNIEREVEMSGPIHAKGVLILSAFLGARYAEESPLSLSASLVFEQSYGGVEGDSASSTELYALLSSIGEIPLKQSIGVTGSVNQHGDIQPIGGVNDKIEGFYDICEKRGLTGEQGVMIPYANVKNLMLRDDIVKAVEDNKFHIYAVHTIDEGMELLTDLEMGERNEKGDYPENTVNFKVESRLKKFASIQQQFSGRGNHQPQKSKEAE
jgi:lon-related putative ATP-dependent protease